MTWLRWVSRSREQSFYNTIVEFGGFGVGGRGVGTPSAVQMTTGHRPPRLGTMNARGPVRGKTWFQIPTLPEVVKTHRGSRPGSPLADIVWHALMMDIHKEATEALSHHEPTRIAYQRAGLQPEVITWSDDLVIPIPVLTAQELLPATTYILQKTMQSFTTRGLMNLKRGKTTGVPTFKGTGAPALRAQYLLHKDPGLDVEDTDGRVYRLPLACSYRYLGACYVPEGGREHEMDYYRTSRIFWHRRLWRTMFVVCSSR